MQSPPRPVLTTRAARRLRGSFGEVSWKVPSRLGEVSNNVGCSMATRRGRSGCPWAARPVRHTMYCLAWIRSLFPSATAITPVRPLIVCSAAEDTHNGKQSSRCTVMRRARPRVRRTRRGCYSAGACASVRACVPRRMGSGIGPAHAPAEGKMRRHAKKTIKEANKRAHAGNMSMSQP
jgi:predicted nucleic acid-binding Zn ribbon protein